MKSYDLYLLDFDGTTFNTYESLIDVYRKGFQAIGEDCTAREAGEYMHMSLSQTCALRNITGDKVQTFIKVVDEEIDDPESLKLIKIYDDTLSTINGLLARKKKVAIVSGNTKKHIDLILDEFDMQKLFSCVVGCDPSRKPKPSADPINFALKSFPTIAKDKVVYVGDSLQDPETAKNAGVDGILLERKKEYPDYAGTKISSLTELLAFDELETINLCYTGNQKMFDGILMSSLSVAMSNPNPLHVYLLTADLTKYHRNYKIFTKEDGLFIENVLKRYNPKSQVDVIDCGDLFIKNFRYSVNFSNGYTPYSFMRLLLDEIDFIPERILYLDTDILVLKSIQDLYDTNLNDYHFAFVTDQVGEHYFGKRYGNTGVLLLNIKKIKDDHRFDGVRKYINHIKLFMPDQTTLNRVCKKTKLLLPAYYNDQLELHENTVIRHYCKRMYWLPIIHTVNIKPWDVIKFRSYFGENTHKELLDSYLEIKKEYLKEHKVTPPKGGQE
jgi:HAD superfamily hydrolase (TIGR01549 family)